MADGSWLGVTHGVAVPLLRGLCGDLSELGVQLLSLALLLRQRLELAATRRAKLTDWNGPFGAAFCWANIYQHCSQRLICATGGGQTCNYLMEMACEHPAGLEGSFQELVAGRESEGALEQPLLGAGGVFLAGFQCLKPILAAAAAGGLLPAWHRPVPQPPTPLVGWDQRLGWVCAAALLALPLPVCSAGAMC